jgi:hypothetical protein
MNSIIRSLIIGIAPLLMGLSLALRSIPTNSCTIQTGVLYVAPTAQSSGDCSGWANACTLQYALSIAVDCNEIWAQGGIHKPTTDPADPAATFTLKNDVALYGGFAGTETQRDQRDWLANLTVLSGDIDNNDITDLNGVVTDTANIQGNNSYHVVTGSETDNTAALDGVIITAGQANSSLDWLDTCGGGMYNERQGSPMLSHIIFSGNTARFCGGGMVNFASSPTLIDVTFSSNMAYSGGGMFTIGGSPTLDKTNIDGNTATEYGGGMYNDIGSSPTLTNVIFSNNTAGQGGGGILNSAIYSSTLTGVVFMHNVANFGGGIYNEGSSITLTNVTFNSNAANTGGGVYNGYSSNPTLTNCILWGNTASSSGPQIYDGGLSNATVTYSDVQGGYSGTGNINADPLFVDATNGDLRLQEISPAIDAGNNAAVPAGVITDLDGKPRFVDVLSIPNTGDGTPPIVDMGAYEVWVVSYYVFVPLVSRNVP